jgi:biotin synthase
VSAGINGVMMGNFLTTLGNEPATDRAMFEELGLNVARQPDNASNARPDNRSGWLAGETPDVVGELLSEVPPPAAVDLNVRLWDPSTQLRYRAKGPVPRRPDGAVNKIPDPAPVG